MSLRRLIELYRGNEERHQATIARLRRAREESDRLRAELSHVEHEIYELWESDVPRRRKLLLESVLRVRCRRLQHEIRAREWEVWHSGHTF